MKANHRESRGRYRLPGRWLAHPSTSCTIKQQELERRTEGAVSGKTTQDIKKNGLEFLHCRAQHRRRGFP
ncbi:hypothetical protein I7I53_11671 [Histoplasma capsulatum var. duboisii H88]|uniref:Uncharacterized protein n=1 Tax=Ajellomyces capsulatus (strain H88) TaxID=544711 RepID=A0A8A1LU78_AJEC8|nr:hypothetical protein I7I53_11671 [Histoplasma capsulatum var. duboisii H88]